jgi:YidC/Oxa1 family membrane protein insertase
MSIKTVLIASLFAFVALCTFLVVESGLFAATGSDQPEAIVTPAVKMSPGAPPAEGEDSDFDFSKLTAVSGTEKSVTIGSIYPDTGFKFALELTSKGAAITRATLAEFDDRDPENPQPLVLLAPVREGQEIYSLASGSFELVEQKQRFPLDRVNWRLVQVERQAPGPQSAQFEVILKDAAGKDAIRLTKIYRLMPDSHQVECNLAIENLADEQLKALFNLQGPAGIGREGARADMRNLVAAFVLPEGIESVKTDNNKLRKAKKTNNQDDLQLRHKKAGAHFIWAATTNKYFAAILRPVPQENEQWPQSITVGAAQYYDPGLADKKPDGDENSSFSLRTSVIELSQAGQPNSSKDFEFQLYLGPKDKDIFDKNDLYKKLAYFHTIDFRDCCCPAWMIHPLAFGIMGLMKWMYTIMGPFGNYGIVIMILVFLVRILMHPVTKKSQVSMMKMQKLGPKMEEIKKKYANNKAELNKQVMALYKEQGVSPFASMLPMMLQMPIWIALWTAVYTSIDLRGAPFLPFWITDLSVPDALIRFKEITIPLVGWQIDSFNLLPILMGVVMYLQQKLMPHSSSAQTDSQVAQQQKMMMVMMTLMFPIMLYKGPSGVNLYIMSSITAGVIEQMVIRRHIRRKEAEEATGLVSVTSKTGGKVRKKKPKPFFKY